MSQLDGRLLIQGWQARGSARPRAGCPGGPCAGAVRGRTVRAPAGRDSAPGKPPEACALLTRRGGSLSSGGDAAQTDALQRRSSAFRNHAGLFRSRLQRTPGGKSM